MRKKRGIVEVQFNWIFVLIAGGIILTFFIALAVKQRGASERVQDVTTLNKVEAILTGALASTGSVNFIDVGDAELRFSCDTYGFRGLSKPLLNRVVFVTAMVNGKRLVTWTLPWNVPYRVMNFLYLTSPEIRYILVYDPTVPESMSLLEGINASAQKEIGMEMIEINHLKDLLDKNNRHIRLIFLNIPPSGILLPSFFRKTDFSGVQIQPENELEKGILVFFQKDTQNPQQLKDTDATGSNAPYIGKASLWGGIFSKDKATFECLMNKAFQRFQIVTSIYRNRADTLRSYYAAQGNTLCSADFSSIALDKLFSASSGFNDNNVNNVFTAIQNLKQDNENALLHSCSLIY